MLYLLGSILFSSWLTISFKIIARLKINTLQAIVFNYITCVVTGILFSETPVLGSASLQQSWLPWAILMGLIFISLFHVIAFTAQSLGVAIASVASKLSLVIPFVFSIYLYNEYPSWWQVVGIAVALAAVVLTCYPHRKQQVGSTTLNYSVFFLPVLLFLGSGLLDTMIKYVEQTYLDNKNQNDYLVTAFGSAASTGIILLVIQYFQGRIPFQFRSVLAGICIGVPNYFSIWCLLNALKQYPGNSLIIIPVNNMGIVLFSSVVAALFFKEQLSLLNRIGIILALAAISMIAFG